MSIIDPSQDYLNIRTPSLHSIFYPSSIAVVGATDKEGSVGNTLLRNLVLSKFAGDIFPVNPKRTTILNRDCYPNLSAIPKKVDLAVIVIPAKGVLAVIKECVKLGIPSAIIISAGFKELGKDGLLLEQQILEEARKSGLRIIGPNCLGVMNPHVHVNATFAATMALPGKIAFLSQSGAMCTAVLDWSLQAKIGFSAFVSIGSMADIDWGDLISYLGSDDNTDTIFIYMETIGNPRKFLSSVRNIAKKKPVIVIKAGKTEAAAKAAASHTGAMAGSDDIFDACLHRSGALRVDTISELFDMILTLSKQPIPQGPSLCLITNAGGPAVLATDATSIYGAELATLSPETISKLNQFLPPAWSHSNPVDILGDAGADRYEKTINIVAKDSGIDGILVVLSPQDMTDPIGTAKALTKYTHIPGKSILASWMGGDYVGEGAKLLDQMGIPTFPYPDNAAKVFATMWKYKKNIQKLSLQSTLESEKEYANGYAIVRKIIHSIRSEKRTLVTEGESKKILSAYGIPIVQTIPAKTEEEAAQVAEKLGFPVVVKLHSTTITHKSDVGGVKLSLTTPSAVRSAYREILQSVSTLKGKEHFEGVTVQKMITAKGHEIILGSIVDPQFGPVLLFGSGGKYVEVYKDKALALPPLNKALAKELMMQTKIYKILQGVRGESPLSLDTLENLLIRFSHLIIDNPEIIECDINPLLASREEIIALDGRIVLCDPKQELPKPVIMPYPQEYIWKGTLDEDTVITIRPTRNTDHSAVQDFHYKFFADNGYKALKDSVQQERLLALCNEDYEDNITLIAETSTKKIIALAKLEKNGNCTIGVDKSYHNLGIEHKFLLLLEKIAYQRHYPDLTLLILEENHNLINICKNLGFSVTVARKEPAILLVSLFNKINRLQ